MFTLYYVFVLVIFPTFHLEMPLVICGEPLQERINNADEIYERFPQLKVRIVFQFVKILFVYFEPGEIVSC